MTDQYPEILSTHRNVLGNENRHDVIVHMIRQCLSVWDQWFILRAGCVIGSSSAPTNNRLHAFMTSLSVEWKIQDRIHQVRGVVTRTKQGYVPTILNSFLSSEPFLVISTKQFVLHRAAFLDWSIALRTHTTWRTFPTCGE